MKKVLFLRKRSLEIKQLLFFLKNKSKHIVHSKNDHNPLSFFSNSLALWNSLVGLTLSPYSHCSSFSSVSLVTFLIILFPKPHIP